MDIFTAYLRKNASLIGPDGRPRTEPGADARAIMTVIAAREWRDSRATTTSGQSGLDLNHACLRYIWLLSANLRYAILKGTNLQDTDLTNADLRYADLECARLDNATLKGTRLEGAKNLTKEQVFAARHHGEGAVLSWADNWQHDLVPIPLLKMHRERLHLSVDDLAHKSNVQGCIIELIEEPKGGGNASRDTVRKLTRALGLPEEGLTSQP
jgi:hypothetical protein